MAHYADLLRGVDGRTGYNADDPDRVDNNVNWKFTLGARPKKGIDLAFERKEEETFKDGVRGSVEKTSSKLKQNHGDCTTSYTFANDKMACDAVGVAYAEDGWKVNIGSGAEVKQAKSEWKVTGALDVKSPDLSGAKVAFVANLEQNEKSVTTVKPKLNVEIADEFNLGFSGVWKGGFTEKWLQSVYKPADQKDKTFWARADLTRSLASVGIDFEDKDLFPGAQIALELVYGWKGLQGFQGKPVLFRTGYDWDLSDSTSASGSYELSDGHVYSNEISHKYDKNWTLTATQSFDSSHIGTSRSPYHIGFGASYKL